MLEETPRDPHALVTVRFLVQAKPFGRGDLLELPWRDAEGLLAQQIVELVPRQQSHETR